MKEVRTPAEILDLSEDDAASILRAYTADPKEFVGTFQQLESTMPLQCRHCPHLISLAIEVASGEATFEQIVEARNTILNPQECGGAELKVMEYYDQSGELDGLLGYVCLSREIN